MGFYIFLLENISCEPSFEPPQQVSYGDGSHFMRILGELVEFQGKQLCHFLFCLLSKWGSTVKEKNLPSLLPQKSRSLSLGFIAHRTLIGKLVRNPHSAHGKSEGFSLRAWLFAHLYLIISWI